MPDGPGEAGIPTRGALTLRTDIGLWARSSALEIVLFVTGAILATRFAAWLGARITTRIDKHPGDADTILRTEASKHRHAVTQRSGMASSPASRQCLAQRLDATRARLLAAGTAAE